MEKNLDKMVNSLFEAAANSEGEQVVEVPLSTFVRFVKMEAYNEMMDAVSQKMKTSEYHGIIEREEVEEVREHLTEMLYA